MSRDKSSHSSRCHYVRFYHGTCWSSNPLDDASSRKSFVFSCNSVTREARRDEDRLAFLRDRRPGPRPGGCRARDHPPGGERPALHTGASGPSAARPSWLSPPSEQNIFALASDASLLRPSRATPAHAPQVLQHHFPGRALRRDVAELTELPPETELLAAGFPCPVRPNRRVFSELSERRENRARSRKRRRKRNAHTNTRPLYLYTPAIRMSPRSTSGVPVCVTARKPASARTCSAFCARRVRWCLGCCWRTSPAF